jgi:hypothetical protein
MSHKRSNATALLVCGALIAGLALWAEPAAQAMPNFARQYGVSCSFCHTIVPRLNRTGYEFRRAGWRSPSEIGLIRDWEKNRETSLFVGSNYFTARAQANVSYLDRNRSTEAGVYDPKGGSYSVSKIELTELTLYPLTGGFLGNWASMSEISVETDNIEIENAYVRYSRGNEKSFWEARIGVFHPFEGYGASDRPLGLNRPLFQRQATTNAKGQKNGWSPWGFDEAGIEWGLNHKGTSLSAVVFNGLLENAEDPAQGPHLTKEPGSPTENDKDFQLFFNQFFGSNDAAVSAFYYNGHISLGAPLIKDDFDRYSVYLTFPVNKLLLLGGYSAGSDEDNVTHRKAKNDGWFVEADSYLSETLGVGVRYDQFDPSDLIRSNNVSAITGFVNVPLNNGLQLIAEVRSQKNEKGANPSQTTNSLNVRFIYIW